MNCEKVISRKNLTKEEWLVYRRSGIGGSDAGAIAGLNPYSTAYSVYLDKLGEAEPITETEAMRQGVELEEYVAKRFCEQTGKRVKRCEYILRSKAHPFMLADVDRLVVGENAVLECKTTLNRDGYTFDGTDYPAYWRCQCLHYMAVTGAEKAYIAVLIFGRDFRIIEVTRSESIADLLALIEIEERFWNEHVQRHQPPAVDGSARCTELLQRQYPEADEEYPSVDLMPYGAQLERLAAVRREIESLTEEKAEIENLFKSILGEAPCGEYDGYKVTWKNRASSRVDTKALKAEEPEVYAKYLRTTTMRTFLFSEKN